MAKQSKKKTRYAGVFRLEDGRWWIQASQRDATGKRCAKRKVLPNTLSLSEAARARAQLVSDLSLDLEARSILQQSEADGAAETPTTLASYVLSWSARKRHHLRPSTREHYADVLGRFVVPVLGHVPIQDVRRSHVLDWVAWAEGQRNRFDRPYADATLGSWWRVLVTLLKDAAAEFDLSDPTNRVRRPRSVVRNVREGVTLMPEQIAALLETVEETFPKWYAEVFALVFTGVRAGELHALRWVDVDEDAGVIHVRHSVWHGNVSLTKTDDPRELGLTERLAEVLREHRTRLIAEQHPGLDSGLLFPGEHGSFRFATSLQKVLRLAGKAAGIPTRVGPQVIRRTFNTNLVQMGVNGIVLRAQMGHASERMTSRYAGVHARAKRSAVDALHAAVDGGAGNT